MLFLAGAMMLASASNAAAQVPGAQTRPKTYTSPSTWTGDSQKLVKAYRNCLRSDNPGVVESSLGHILWMRIAVSRVDITPLKSDVDELAITGKTAAVRLRAYLTAMVMENPDAFRTLSQQNFDGPHDLFASVASQAYASESGSYLPAVAEGR